MQPAILLPGVSGKDEGPGCRQSGPSFSALRGLDPRRAGTEVGLGAELAVGIDRVL